MSLENYQPAPHQPSNRDIYAGIFSTLVQDHKDRNPAKGEIYKRYDKGRISLLRQIADRENILLKDLKKLFEWFDTQARSRATIPEKEFSKEAQYHGLTTTQIANITSYLHRQEQRMRLIAEEENSGLIEEKRYRGLDGDEWQQAQFTSHGLNNFTMNTDITVTGSLDRGGITVINAESKDGASPKLQDHLRTLVDKELDIKALEQALDIKLDLSELEENHSPYSKAAVNLAHSSSKNLINGYLQGHSEYGDNQALRKYLWHEDYFKPVSTNDPRFSGVMFNEYLRLFNRQAVDHNGLEYKLQGLNSFPNSMEFDDDKFTKANGFANMKKIRAATYLHFKKELLNDPDYVFKTFFDPDYQFQVRKMVALNNIHNQFEQYVKSQGDTNEIGAHYDFAKLSDEGKYFRLITNGDYVAINIDYDLDKTIKNITEAFQETPGSRTFYITPDDPAFSNAEVKVNNPFEQRIPQDKSRKIFKTRSKGILVLSRSTIAKLTDKDKCKKQSAKEFYQNVIYPFDIAPGANNNSQKLIARAMKFAGESDNVAAFAFTRNTRGEKNETRLPSDDRFNSPDLKDSPVNLAA